MNLPPEQSFPELLILTYTCPLKWDEMTGTHAIKHCKQCSLHVPNISHLSETEFEDIFERARRGEQVCMRTEGLGPRKTTKSRTSIRLGLATAMSIASAWVIGFLKMPAFANAGKGGTDKMESSRVGRKV